ncbi:hypothetical protein RUND412_010997 [Rhizina undulata]
MAASSELKLRACDRCAAIKQVCDREEKKACSRCHRLGLTCVINRAHKPMGRPRKMRPYSDAQAESPENSPSEGEESFKTDTNTTTTLCHNNHDDDDNDDGGKNVSSPPPFPRHDKVSSTRTKPISAFPPPKRVHRTRSGCSACKQRRKKCDEVRPTCSDCKRLGLRCSLSAGPNSPISPRSPMALPSVMPLQLSLFNPTSTPEEQHLLQHYALVVSRALSVVPDEINPFQSLFIPMTLEQPAMRNALLALSASHLRRFHPHYEVVMVNYQQMALSQMLGLLEVGTEEALMEGLGTALCLCLHQICEGNSKDWSLHLKAATDIINSLGGPTNFPPSVQFLLEATAYFDSIATLTFSTPANLSHEFYVPTTSSLTAHALFGTAHGIFPLIAEISNLAALKPQFLASVEFKNIATSLLQRLITWTPPPCRNTPSDPSLCMKTTAAAQALQSAALLRLQEIMYGPPLPDPHVGLLVDGILELVQSIPAGDLVESILVFPMVMAGVNAQNEEQRLKVRTRLEVMETSIGFGNVVDARRFVEGAWDCIDRTREEWSWERLMVEGGGKLIMS